MVKVPVDFVLYKQKLLLVQQIIDFILNLKVDTAMKRQFI